MKKILIASIIMMLTIGYGVLPAQAYVELKTPVAITATGTITGVTETFAVAVVAQATGTAASLVFEVPSGKTSDSGEALKITGGTNEVDNRIIIYTENNLNTTPHKVPTENPNTGIDGGGLVGQSDAAITMAMLWGVKSVANLDPNTNENYVFDGNPDDSINEVYIVDKRHTMSFTAVSSTLDNGSLYTEAGVLYDANTDGDGLYPQLWDADLYNSATVRDTTTRVSPALYKTIATLAYGCSKVTTDYTINVPKISTASFLDVVTANIGLAVPIYIYLACNADGKPAQVYSTANLKLAIVKG